LLLKLGDRLGFRGAGIATSLIWAIAPWSVTFAIGGLETSVLVALATATFYLHLSHRPVAAAAAGALALLTRPDALLFLGPLAVARFLELRRGRARPQRRELLVLLLPLAAWAIGSSLYYGSPIPHSIPAKAAAYRIGPEEGLVRLIQHYATPFIERDFLGPLAVRVGVFVYPILYSLGAITLLRSERSNWPLVLYPSLYFAVYAIANPLLFRWYLTPPLPAYFFTLFAGASRISQDLRSRAPLLALTAFALVSTANAWTLRPDHGSVRPAPEMAFIKLELVYEQAAGLVRRSIEADQTLAAADIGALGYYSGAPVLDLLGLISPEATPYYPAPESMYVINFAIPPELVHELKPDLIVTLEVYGRNGLLIDPDFQRDYRLLDALSTDVYGSRGLLIFERVPAG
jgi:hypothetical protein